MKDNIFEHLIESDPENADILFLLKFNILDKVYNYGDHLNSKKKGLKKYTFLFKFLSYGLPPIHYILKILVSY